LEFTFAKSSLLDDLRRWCKKKGWKLERAFRLAVEWSGRTYEEEAKDNPKLTFLEYVENLLSVWIEVELKLPEVLERWDGIKVEGECSRCGKRLEYDENEKDRLTCPKGCGRYLIPCRVCGEMGYSEDQPMLYNPDENTFTCMFCGLERPVVGPPLKPEGTYMKYFYSMSRWLSPKAKELIKENPKVEEIILSSFPKYIREDQERLATLLRPHVKKMLPREVSKFIKEHCVGGQRTVA